MTETADVVVYAVDLDAKEFCSWGRDTMEVAQAFCRRPEWPAKRTDDFFGVDNWGYATGRIVAASPSLSNWLGKKLETFQREAGFERVPALSR